MVLLFGQNQSLHKTDMIKLCFVCLRILITLFAMGTASSSPPPIGGSPQRVRSHIGLQFRQAEMVKISQKKPALMALEERKLKRKRQLGLAAAKCLRKMCILQLQDSRLHFYLTSRFGKIAVLIKFLVGDRSALLICTCQESVDHVHF